MCGILGFVGANNQPNRDLIKALTLQLSLRGTHATGLAWLNDETGLRCVSVPASAEEFWDKCNINHGAEVLKVVAHTRYSTSDLKWNQPLADDNIAMVMNGVISQETPDKWPNPYPLHNPTFYQTGNDVEIALAFSLAGRRAQMSGSWAICELNANGQLLAYRNHARPLWAASGPDQSWRCVCSTADALLRCGLRPIALPPGEVLDLGTAPVKVIQLFPTSPDLQSPLNSQWPDLQCSL